MMMISVCIVSIYRIPKLYGLSLVDASWSNADTTIWSLVEVSVAIACACAIVYRPLFNWIFRSNVSAGSGSDDSSRKKSRPSVPYVGQRGVSEWGKDGGAGEDVKMQRAHTFERGSLTPSQSRLREEEWDNLR